MTVRTAAAGTATVEDELAVPKDDDPDGQKLLKADDFLEVAMRFVRPLETMASDRMATWLLSYRVAMARGARGNQAKRLA